MVSSNERSRMVEQTIRELEEYGIDILDISEEFQLPEYDNDSDPPVGTYYYNTSDDKIKRREGQNTVKEIAGDGTAPIQSVFGRTGDITSQSGDYDHTQITGVSSDDHHVRFSNDSTDALSDIPNRQHSSLNGVGASDHHTRFTDDTADSLSDIPNRQHSSLNGIGASDHHVRFGDDSADALSDIPNRPHSGLNSINEDDHHQRGGFTRTDVASTTYTASRWESIWVDTAGAGGAVTITLPSDSNSNDGDRVDVVAEDGTNNTDVTVNTGQTMIGSNPTLSNAGESLTYEYKASTSSWVVR